jgi:LuxR family maltose regulon positive regulatory protein
MSRPLLKTKLFIPSLVSGFVARPSLSAELDAGLDKRLSLVAAPAGFGKTTFISSWVRNIEYPVVWISLDEADNDPAVFWAYVVTGFQRALSDDGSNMGQITTDQLTPTKTTLTHLINSLAENKGKVILVLDDYHLISNPHIHEDLTFLIDNQPLSLHIVLITRADPPLPISRLRGRGLLTELRATDLRFTNEETTTFFNRIMGLELAPADIATLEERTEGWAIGLQLAAISMQGRQNISEFVDAFSGGHHYVLEYLTDEIVGKLSKARRVFLLKTSILRRMCGPLCDYILDTNDSSEVLADLQRENLFITSLDDEYYWYRYNHLFVDLLGNILRKEFSQDEIFALHRKASQWHQENGFHRDAIEHAMLAQDFEWAAGLMEKAASATMIDGRLTTLLRWVDSLPESLLGIRPRLRFYKAWALSLSGQPQTAETILLDAKSSLDCLPDSPDNLALRGELAALLTGIITYTNDPQRILQEAEEALTYLPEDSIIPHARVRIAQGTAYAYSDEFEGAIQLYQQARDLALRAKNPFLAAAAIEMIAGVQIFHLGQLHKAQRNLQQILALGKTQDGTYLAFTGTAHILLAETNLEWNNLEVASRYLAKGFELLQQGGIGYCLTHAYCTKARLMLSKGKIENANKALQSANQATQTSPLMHILVHNISCQVKLALYLGDNQTASKWAEGEKSVLPDNLPIYLQEVLQISKARVYYAQGALDNSIEILDRILPHTEASGRLAHATEICLLKAIVFQEQGKSAAAIESLERSLSLSIPESYTRLYLEAGSPAKILLQSAKSKGIYPEYVHKILTSFDTQTALTKLPKRIAHLDRLTERECEILTLISVGYSNQQIANELVITLNTVKKHVSNIYDKLGVKNRAQAIAKGRELEII